MPHGKGIQQWIEFDRPCMEDLRSLCNSVQMEQQACPSHWGEALPAVNVNQIVSSAQGPAKDVTEPSCLGPDPSSGLVHHADLLCGKTLDASELEKVDNFTRTREDRSRKNKSKSPEVTVKDVNAHDDCNDIQSEKLKYKSGLFQPPVDEFGRLLRQTVSDSDGDDVHSNPRKRLRWASSRNRGQSRCPGNVQPKHWTPGGFSHKWIKRSQSWSSSPRRNKGHSQTPPWEAKWGGTGKGEHRPLHKDGRKVVKGSGRPSHPCFDFVKGKCFRGLSCKFVHEEFSSETHSQGGRSSDGQEKHQSFPGRKPDLQSGLNRSAQTEDVKLQISWEGNGSSMDDYSRETELTHELKSRGRQYSNDEGCMQDEGNSERSLAYCTDARQPEVSTGGFTPCVTVNSPSESQWGRGSRPGQKMSALPSHLSSQEHSALSLTSTSANLKLGSRVGTSLFQQKSSVTLAPQLLHNAAHAEPPFSIALTCQLSDCKPNMPIQTRKEVFASNPVRPPVSPTLSILKSSFPPLPISQPQTLDLFRQGKSSQAPNNSRLRVTQFISPAYCAQPHMLLQAPQTQIVHAKQPWIPPCPPALVGTYSEGLSQGLPLQLSGGKTNICSFSVPFGHLIPPFSTASLNNVATWTPFGNEQYDPWADSIEPGPPGSEGKSLVSNLQSLSQESLIMSTVERHAQQPDTASDPLMAHVGEVVLGKSSPDLLCHLDSVMTGNGNTDPKSCTVRDNVSITNVMASSKEGFGNLGGTPQPPKELVEKVTPDGKTAEVLEKLKESIPKAKEKEARVLHLLRQVVAANVKDLLKPTWREGQMSKEAFKTIAKKAVDKIMGALHDKGQIPKSQERLDVFINTSKPKIAKLVQGYVNKYVRP